MISILKTDFYKATHMLQYRDDITHFTSYLVPRNSRISIDKMVVFGITNFVNEFLVRDFNENFFSRDMSEIADDVYEVLGEGLGYKEGAILKTLNKIKELHQVGYLPIKISGLPEGSVCPMGVPAIEISSTVPSLAWVAQAIESLLSCEIWHPCISATVAHEYAKIAAKAYEKTCDDNIDYRTGMCDFSMRGQESYHSAVASGAAFLTSFFNSSTIESRFYIKNNYVDKKKIRANGLTSTEHSVMCSDYAICGDERETYKRLLTEVYPDTSFAAVCDSYDFWNVVTNILPSLRDEIEAHNGFLGVRHDSSSDPVHALCGIDTYNLNEIYGHDSVYLSDIEETIIDEDSFVDYVWEMINDDWSYFFPNAHEVDERLIYVEYTKNRGEDEAVTFSGVFKMEPEWESDRGERGSGEYTFINSICVEKIRDTRTWEDKGLVESLYELFGGTLNSKGFKVMNPKLKAVYGDSITISRAREIYRRLEAKGFAANNVSLGVGSFSMECIEEKGELKPFTRDTFSIAVKATYGQRTENGEIVEFPILKDPKGCSAKKSLKGLCVVKKTDNNYEVIQNLNIEEYKKLKNINQLVPYFVNGIAIDKSFNDIRNRLKEDIVNGDI